MASRWSELLGDLLDEIEAHLVLYCDKVRIRVVCSYWNSHLEKVPNQKELQLPSLFQPLDKNNNKDGAASHGLFNLVEKKLYYFDLPAIAKGKLFMGYSHGWLSTMQYVDPNPSNYAIDMHLINPFTNDVIQLPPRIKLPDVVEYCADRVDNEYKLLLQRFDDDVRTHSVNQIVLIYIMGKVIVSSPPSHDDFVVVAIYGMKSKLAYWRPNDKKWTPIRTKFTASTFGGLSDILFHKGKLYGLSMENGLVRFEDISPNPKITEIVAEGPPINPTYLVECSDGGLLMVTRIVETVDGENACRISRTVEFEVYRPDDSSWVQVEDIGDDILFLGYNSSVSRSSRDFPGYEGNCIYFTDSDASYSGEEFKQQDSDIGIFNMKDGSIQRFPSFKCSPRFIWPPPIWVTPLGCMAS